jgi:signal transduction histidine kinase
LCYFPFRQWLWAFLSRDNQQTIETYFPHLSALFVYSIDSRDFDTHWRRLLRRIFEPLDIASSAESLTTPQIREDGLVLSVPGIRNTETLMLTARNRGQRLFTRKDQRLAAALVELAQQSLRQQQEHMKSVFLERSRILRDLHDDVAAPLMMLTHRAETPEYRKLAGNALMALREAVHGLEQPEAVPLWTMLANWRTEARERLEAADVALCWEEGSLPEATLTPHERINLGRVLREAISNEHHH